MYLFSTRLRNSSTHIPDNARCSANRSFRRLFSGSVLMRLLMSWMVDYVSTHRHARTLLSCVDSRKRFAAALRRAMSHRSHAPVQRVVRMCSYLYSLQIVSWSFSSTLRGSCAPSDRYSNYASHPHPTGTSPPSPIASRSIAMGYASLSLTAVTW